MSNQNQADAVAGLLDELIATQERIQREFENSPSEESSRSLEIMKTRVTHYCDLLKTISKDMVEICERVDALKNRINALSKP